MFTRFFENLFSLNQLAYHRGRQCAHAALMDNPDTASGVIFAQSTNKCMEFHRGVEDALREYIEREQRCPDHIDGKHVFDERGYCYGITCAAAEVKK